jgi:hypothetical protein
MEEECMSFWDDAQAFMREKEKVENVPNDNRECLIVYLRNEFENATRIEVERALDRLAEREKIPDDFEEVLKKVRIWLED